MSYTKTAAKGFTLVELAIALMIIGLLIGGVLKGQELAENARSAQYVRQIKSYVTAYNAFLTIYGGVPGDLKNPSTKIPGCSAAPCMTTGDGDGFIRSGAFNMPAIPSLTHSGNVMMFGENRNFWVHMAKANLIIGVDADYNTGAYSGRAGVETPAAPDARVAFGVAGYPTEAVVEGSANIPGNYLAIFNNNLASSAYNAMLPSRAFYIDQKLDDGLPFSGSTRSAGHWSASTTNTSCYTGTEYNIHFKDRAICNILTLID